eukprot:8213196-Alexandrium_andersonii.AAC.1
MAAAEPSLSDVVALLQGQSARFDSLDGRLLSLDQALSGMREDVSDVKNKYKELSAASPSAWASSRRG